jgi:hypothetical protein
MRRKDWRHLRLVRCRFANEYFSPAVPNSDQGSALTVINRFKYIQQPNPFSPLLRRFAIVNDAGPIGR